MPLKPQPDKKADGLLDKEKIKIKEAKKSLFGNIVKAGANTNNSLAVSGTSALSLPSKDDGKTAGFSSSFNAISFWILTVLSLFLAQTPIISLLFAPVTQFTTMVHELSHALVCIATGGYITGLTIVSDGAGHGGLTNCIGGMPFFYTQAGYLGTAIFGSLLIFVGQYPRLSKFILIFLGTAMAAASLFLIGGNVLSTGLAGVGSFLWGIVMSAFLIFAGIKLKPHTANLLLLFLAIQTALNSFTGILYLVQLGLGLSPSGGAWSDASNMASMPPYIPAVVWSLFWFLSSVALLTFTIWHTYGKRIFKVSNKKTIA
ncbi:MAG: M50 family metallopeptidase [Candidatus Obscuribacterales bacterium]|nr:M50 family metallopeptidase [Candidatus Obscuribacterales bacterium]